MLEVDADGSGQIDFNEFLAQMKSPKPAKHVFPLRKIEIVKAKEGEETAEGGTDDE